MKTDKTIYSKYILIKLTNIGLNLTNFVIKLTLFLNQPTILPKILFTRIEIRDSSRFERI